jgi:predicted TIM-barrel fold metal-dependent hydrolase
MTQTIIDAHHHIWHKNDVPWLAAEPKPRIFGEYEEIRRDYLIEEYREDISAFNVTGSIYMQANWGLENSLKEAQWVNSVGDQSGIPNALVAFAELDHSELDELLRAYSEIPRVCGIRHQIHWHENPNYAYVSAADVYNNVDWRKGLVKVTDAGLPFDLQVFPRQLSGAARMVADFPETTFILNHAGMLDSRDSETVKIWENGIADLAQHTNVYCKLTGLGTFDRKSSVELIEPIIAHAIGQFGPERCIFGSNFPVEKMWTTYAELCDHFIQALPPLSKFDQSQILGGSAIKAYQLQM